MFTGIVETLGTLQKIENKGSNIIWTIASNISNKLKIDESVCHDGVCLTVIKKDSKQYKVELIAETLSKTRFKKIKPGAILNLERSLKIGDRLSGHFVQGHIDTTSHVIKIENLNGSWKFVMALPKEFRQLIVPKGSITINGISLTVSALKKSKFEVCIIPYTFNHTNLQYLKVGDSVNIEFDLLGKYINQMLFHSLKK